MGAHRTNGRRDVVKKVKNKTESRRERMQVGKKGRGRGRGDGKRTDEGGRKKKA